MANIIEACNEVFTEEYALAKIFVYAIPVFICVNAFATGQFVLSYMCGFFVILLLMGLLSSGINNLRNNKNEILTFNIQQILIATLKSAIAIIPHISIAVMIAIFTKELIPEIDGFPQFPMIANITIWSLLFSIVMTSYLSFAKHLSIKDAYNIKIIYESVVDVFVNLVFIAMQMIIANSVFVGLMVYVFTLFNIKLSHPGFLFYCSILVIVNLSVLANFLAQASYDYIKGNDEDYNDRYKIGSTISSTNFPQSGASVSNNKFGQNKTNIHSSQNAGIGRSNVKNNAKSMTSNKAFGNSANSNFKTNSGNNLNKGAYSGNNTSQNKPRSFGVNSNNLNLNKSNSQNSGKNLRNTQQGNINKNQGGQPNKRNFGNNQSNFGQQNRRPPNGENNFGNKK